MRILLDARPLQSAGSDAERTRLILSAVAALAAEGTAWIILTDHRYRADSLPGLPGTVVTRRALPGKTGWKWWYDRTIPATARRMKAELLMLPAGIAAADCGIAQCVWMPGESQPTGAAAIYAARLNASLERANAVLCFSAADRLPLAGDRPELRDKLRVLHPFPRESHRPLTPAEKEAVRSELTGGREYFFADLGGAGEAGAVDLLKAFSLFKKRQHSQMRLVLGGRTPDAAALREKLKTYRYREDVDWPEAAADGDERVLGAAYAAVLPLAADGLGIPLLNAWKAGVPAIVAGNEGLLEMAGDAAIGLASDDPALLAGQLMRIYKEEHVRGELIRKGFARLTGYSRDRFLQTVRAAIAAIGAVPAR